MRSWAYCTLAGVLLAGPAAAQPQVAPGTATFNVFVRSAPVGFEQTEISRSENGWIIRSRGDLDEPIARRNQLFEIEYDEQWRPLSLSVSGVRRDGPFSLTSTFGVDGATTDLEEAGQRVSLSDTVPPDAVVLPDYVFAGYEVLALRLAGAEPGDEIPVYVAPRGSTRAQVLRVTTQQIETSGAVVVDATAYHISFLDTTPPLTAEVWADTNQRLLRVSIPDVAIDVARDDIVEVGARVRRVSHPGDEEARVNAEGFSLAVTVTTPVDQPQPEEGWPAVLLVPSPGAPDRDGTLSGRPILGQIAVALADAGYLVARYDRRGVGQSGGRPESADVESHAEDARSMVRYLDRREDVDRDRITVLGYAEGGWTALLTAAKERRADALVLVGAPGTTGTELVMEQQLAALDRLETSETERAEMIALQQRIHDAVLGDGSWDDVPPAMRRQADTIWFRSFLEFDTAETMRRTRQPILIIHGSEDRRIPAYHADRLGELARARRREAPVEQITLDGLDHLFAETGPGALAEYGDLREPSIGPSLVNALTEWLGRTPRD